MPEIYNMIRRYCTYYYLPGSMPSVLGESRGAKIVANRTTTLLQRSETISNHISGSQKTSKQQSDKVMKN
jgi:hypothetical protein